MKEYGMFTQAGNEAIAGLVATAKLLEMDGGAVRRALEILAENPQFGEATDTVVREAVGVELGFYQ